MIFSSQRHGQDEMTINDMLHDPLIRVMLRADGVSLATFAIILETAARNLTVAKEIRLTMESRRCQTAVLNPDLDQMELFSALIVTKTVAP